MKPIIEYKIVVTEQVQNLIDKGWQPFGSVYSEPDSNFWQPMVKYEEESLPQNLAIPHTVSRPIRLTYHQDGSGKMEIFSTEGKENLTFDLIGGKWVQQ